MAFSHAISLIVDIPICSFRRGSAREYLETEKFPPPSTVYGFLLSLIGEEDRNTFINTEISIARIVQPELSTVFRTCWRVKKSGIPPGVGENKRPDFQELLTGLQILIWVQAGKLAEKLWMAKENPCLIERFGGLSLGESRDLVNEIIWCPENGQQNCEWLYNDECGIFTLPVWVDHVGTKNSVWSQFSVMENSTDLPGPEDVRWIRIIRKSEL